MGRKTMWHWVSTDEHVGKAGNDRLPNTPALTLQTALQHQVELKR
jgi:hypothetical protein